MQPSSLVHKIAIIGKDNRKLLPSQYKGLSKKIGILYEGEMQTSCTAFCLAPNVIATAAHCLYGAGKKKPHLSEFIFQLDDKKNGTFSQLAGAEQNITNRYVLSGLKKYRSIAPMNSSKDWAIAKLEQPACIYGGATVSPTTREDLAKAPREKPIFQVGYHWDFNQWKLIYSPDCQIFSRHDKKVSSRLGKDFVDTKNLLLHNCDTAIASSGSPLFIQRGNKPVIVGINVGTYEFFRDDVDLRGPLPRRNISVISNTAVNISSVAPLADFFTKEVILESDRDIKSLQYALKKKKLYKGAIDGKFGAKTSYAIKKYETDEKLRIAGLPTLGLLDRILSRSMSLPTRNPEPGRGKPKPSSTPPLISMAPANDTKTAGRLAAIPDAKTHNRQNRKYQTTPASKTGGELSSSHPLQTQIRIPSPGQSKAIKSPEQAPTKYELQRIAKKAAAEANPAHSARGAHSAPPTSFDYETDGKILPFISHLKTDPLR